jgi:hypothetical protein
MHRYVFDQFALVPEKPILEPSLNGPLQSPINEEGEMPPSFDAIFLKIHLYSTLEVKQTTIMQVLNCSFLDAS